jgi:spectinomycin phosphotransferase
MREPPVGLADTMLRGCLRDQYGLIVTALAFLPLGHDASAWAYRVQALERHAYFLKLRPQVANAAGLLVPRALHDHGLNQVVAPLTSATGALWTAAGDYAAILYPFVAGATAMERGLSEPQWIAYGALLRQVHEMNPAPDLA